MGIFKSIKEKFSKKPKIEVLTDKGVAGLSLNYCNEVKLLSHAVDVSKAEDRAYFSQRADKYIKSFPKVLEDVELAKIYAEADVVDFVDTGDDILAHNTQDYYDDMLADWKSAPILIQISESKLLAAYTALCQLKDLFDQKTQDYDKELVEKVAKDDSTVAQMQRKAKMLARGEVAAMDSYNPFSFSKETLSSIGKAASIATMGIGIATVNPALTATGAAAYHMNKSQQEAERE